jgi:hypothetical protein
VYRDIVLRAAHKIQGLYYRWHSRRLKLRSHLNFLNHGVVLMQSYFRMRAAIQFSNVIRLALHNKKAGMIQRQVRRMLGLRTVTERRRRYKYIYTHLLGQIRAVIQSLSNANTETSDVVHPIGDTDSGMLLLTGADDTEHAQPPAPQYRTLTCRESQVEALDCVLSNLLALGKYDIVRRIGAAMALTAHTEESHRETTASSDYAPPLDTKELEGSGCVSTAAQLALTAVYLGLSACWTRAGKMRFTRADYMEEALGLMMQHSAVALAQAQRRAQQLAVAYHSGDLDIDSDSFLPAVSFRGLPTSANGYNLVCAEPPQAHDSDLVRPFADPETQEQPSLNTLGPPPHSLPMWLLDMEESSVDLYYMSILAMKGVTSVYDCMILMADWVWYQACVQEHNAAAEDFVLMQAADSRAQIREQRARAAAAEAEAQAASLIGHASAPAGALSKQPTHTGPLSLADLVAAQQAGQLVAVEEGPTPYVDPAYAQHERYLQESAFRRRFAVRRVNGLLHRARKLLSAESRDRKEITDRLELFHDLHMTEHRALLWDARLYAMPYRAHFYTQQQQIERQRMASAAATSAKVSRMQAMASKEPSLTAWTADSTGSGALEVDVQIVLCGKTVLIKGSVLLHRLVEAVDDLPPGCALPGTRDINSRGSVKAGKSSKSNARKGRSSKSAKRFSNPAECEPYTAEPVRVAVRPFVLLRAEVGELIDIINEELGIIDIVGAANAAAGLDDTASEASFDSSTVGSQAQSAASSALSSQAHHHRHGHNHHGYSMPEYHRLTEYLQQHLRLVSAQDAFLDPALSDIVRTMRLTARERLGHNKHLYGHTDSGTSEEAGVIEPSVPSVRFALPVIEYKRKIFNESQTVVHATHLLQRVYRGYQGRAKFRRMRWKRTEYERQAERTRKIRADHDAVRFWRGQRLTVIQRLYRGYRWRTRLYALRCASLIVQCAFRMFRARRIVLAERRRRSEGAPVVPMLGHGRGVQIGDIKFTLKMFRSGTNYRLEGIDLMRGVVYEGAVYTPEVLRLIHDHNAGISGTTLYANSQRIQPWQHERVTELIISNLGLMPKITALTTQLGARTPTQTTQYILVANKYANRTARPVQPPATQQQLHGTVSQSILEVATAHTQKQRLQRYAQFRQERRYRKDNKQPTK